MVLRYERKYLVSYNVLSDLRKRLMPFVKPDIFAASNKEFPEYTVRSIYFDSLKYRAVDEKVEGTGMRKKLRIRGYNTLDDNSIVFLEIKRKITDRIAKNRASLLYKHLSSVLLTGEYEQYLTKKSSKMADDASRFMYNYYKYHMIPVNRIVYEREPYHGLFDPGVRITFDKNIRSAIFPEKLDIFGDLNEIHPWPKHFILEIKYFESPMPIWAKSIVQEFELKQEALSKYVSGYLCHPLIDNFS
jgi:SPX domain protein involved in polyphosphate accumulation